MIKLFIIFGIFYSRSAFASDYYWTVRIFDQISKEERTLKPDDKVLKFSTAGNFKCEVSEPNSSEDKLYFFENRSLYCVKNGVGSGFRQSCRISKEATKDKDIPTAIIDAMNEPATQVWQGWDKGKHVVTISYNCNLKK